MKAKNEFQPAFQKDGVFFVVDFLFVMVVAKQLPTNSGM